MQSIEGQYQSSVDESARNNISEYAQDLRDVGSDDVGTVYSDASSLPAWNNKSYISELANSLSRDMHSEKPRRYHFGADFLRFYLNCSKLSPLKSATTPQLRCIVMLCFLYISIEGKLRIHIL